MLRESERTHADPLRSVGAMALQNVSIKVSAGQQLVVCGRTGRYVPPELWSSLMSKMCGLTWIRLRFSGKSTLMLTLLRLLDMKSGTIKVDGIDLSLVPRSLIRQRCFITVAQDPFILGQASLRFNLDVSHPCKVQVPRDS